MSVTLRESVHIYLCSLVLFELKALVEGYAPSFSVMRHKSQ